MMNNKNHLWQVIFVNIVQFLDSLLIEFIHSFVKIICTIRKFSDTICKSVKSGSDKLINGANKLKKGSNKLHKATGKVADGIGKLSDCVQMIFTKEWINSIRRESRN